MNTLRVVVLTGVALAVAGAALNAEPPKQAPVAAAAPRPQGMILKNLHFKSVVPKTSALAVPVLLHLKFDCMLGWGSGGGSSNRPSLRFTYNGTKPVQTQQLVVHWEVSYCCNGNLGAPTTNFLLYPGQGFEAFPPELPTNLNRPPEGQPQLTCPAFGWLDQ